MNEYCTKVNILQWDILVTTCYELGIKIQKQPDINLCTHYTYVKYSDDAGITTWKTMEDKYEGEINFQEFLTKLRKIKRWTPKKGEMVEASENKQYWTGTNSPLYFISSVENGKRHVLWDGGDRVFLFKHIRPVTRTMTVAEAEKTLKKLGINIRIVSQ